MEGYKIGDSSLQHSSKVVLRFGPLQSINNIVFRIKK